jgi:hypothetical protein
MTRIQKSAARPKANQHPLVFERTSEAGKREPAADMPKRARYTCGVPLVLDVPIAPVPLAGGGRTHLCYELHIMNTSCRYRSSLVAKGRVTDCHKRGVGGVLPLIATRPLIESQSRFDWKPA